MENGGGPGVRLRKRHQKKGYTKVDAAIVAWLTGILLLYGIFISIGVSIFGTRCDRQQCIIIFILPGDITKTARFWPLMVFGRSSDILPSATVNQRLGCYEMPSSRRLLSNSTTKARTQAKSRGKCGSRDATVATSLAAKSEKSRNAILISAAALFRHQGYSATTLRQIAGKARIKAGSIYYYFDSKEEILAEVLERGLRHVFELGESCGQTSRAYRASATNRFGDRGSSGCAARE